MIAVWVLLMAGLVSSDLLCSDGKRCQDKHSCCPTETGYECCAYPNAVCCPDKKHCCPQDYQCNLQTNLCERQGLLLYRIPLSPQISGDQQEKEPLSPPLSSSIVHCDNTYVCPDGTTCCRSPYGTWTCCPFNMGQCCRDGYHCCPHGYHCDSTSTQCLQGELSLPSVHIPAKSISSVQISGEQLEEEPLSPPQESTSLSSSVVHCDNTHYCPDGTTCCRSPYGTWSCCPVSMGQCCRDGVHCCRHGYHCDSTSTRCLRGDLSLPSVHIPAELTKPTQISGEQLEEEPLSPPQESTSLSSSIVHCDNTYVCPDGTTCCRSPYGTWTCCPFNMGQCCRDGYHCCPHGYHCDSTSTQCLQGELSLPSVHIPAKLISSVQISGEQLEEEPLSPPQESTSLSSSVVHCDNTYVCPDGTTCCRSPYGTWTCCPFNMGQCCRDGYHCCPHGYHCDSTSTQCLQGELSLPSVHIPAELTKPTQISGEQLEEEPLSPPQESTSLSSSIVHCDNTHYCRDGTTCCRSPYGTWSCCPVSMGQCCRDGVHCCRHGYHCDSTSTRCLRGDLSLPAVHIPAELTQPTQDQCCLSETGCCPVGFRCDENSRACVSELDVQPLQQDLDNQIKSGVIRCNTRFYCPAGSTCCRATTGLWGCCPYALGQCCKDGKHCCEYRYTCDRTFTKCVRGYITIPATPMKKVLLL